MGDEIFGKEIPRTGSGFGMTHIDQLQQRSATLSAISFLSGL